VFVAEPLPTRDDIQPALDRIHDDAMYLGDVPDELRVDLRVGIYDSKGLPARSHFLRYERFRRIVTEVLVPLHAKHPIKYVRIA
jgi:hypothetical protein